MSCNLFSFETACIVTVNGTQHKRYVDFNYHAACICSLISVSLGIYKCEERKSKAPIPLLANGEHKLTLLFEFPISRIAV